MRNNALCRAAELTPPVRAAFEGILGRHLGDDETVSINAYPSKPAPTGEARTVAFKRLAEFGDKLAQRVKDVPEQELDAAIDEAVDHARHHPE